MSVYDFTTPLIMKDVIEMTGLSRTTLLKHIWRGHLKAEMKHAVWRFQEKDVKYFMAHRRGPGRPRDKDDYSDF